MESITRSSSVEEYRFKQVSDEKRIAICKKMPYMLAFFMLSVGLMFLVDFNKSSALTAND